MVRSASNTFDRSGCVELRGHHGASFGLVPLHLDDTLLLSGSNFHAGGVHEGGHVCFRQDANGRIPCRRGIQVYLSRYVARTFKIIASEPNKIPGVVSCFDGNEVRRLSIPRFACTAAPTYAHPINARRIGTLPPVKYYGRRAPPGCSTPLMITSDVQMGVAVRVISDRWDASIGTFVRVHSIGHVGVPRTGALPSNG